MKVLLLAAALLPSVSNAEVIECPERFPNEAAQPKNVSTRQQGITRILPSRLSGAYMVSGALFAEQQFVPEMKKVPGGRDVTYNFPGQGRWLVCEYGGSVEWWVMLNPQTAECELRLRETQVKQAQPKMTATAICK
jgi:hypothetical protein